ncbi:MAG: CDP-alcohol phosphatidyltransferase family protein [Bacteroidota bacterium]|jgi:CDP-diacylglycerol--serine O-phosphatidyltransferase
MNLKSAIPNSLTLSNLVFGLAALISENIHQAFYFIVFAAIADFLDGFVARLLGVANEMGKQLDSLADVVSFGVVPSFLLFKLLHPAIGPWASISFALSAAAAYRLARFNLDTSPTFGFKGLPMPANGLFWMSFLLLNESTHFSIPIVITLIIIFTTLMASSLPLLAIKFKNYGWKGNESRYVVIISILLSITFSLIFLKNFVFGFPIALILYLIISIVDNFFRNHEQIQS